MTPPERHNLPAPVTSFVGREAELAEVGAARRDAPADARPAWAARARRGSRSRRRPAAPDLPDGVFFVDLRVSPSPRSSREAWQAPSTSGSERGRGVGDGRPASARRRAAARARQLRTPARGLRGARSRPARGVPADPDPRDEPRGAGRLPERSTTQVPPLALPRPTRIRKSCAPRRPCDCSWPGARAARPRLRGRRGARKRGPDLPRAGRPAARARAGRGAGEGALAGRDRGRLSDRFRFLVSWRRLTPPPPDAPGGDGLELRAPRRRRAGAARGLSRLRGRLHARGRGRRLSRTATTSARSSRSGIWSTPRSSSPRSGDGEMRYRLLETVRQYAAERLAERSRGRGRRRACAVLPGAGGDG